MYAISTLLFLVAGKASRVHKLTYYTPSIVEQLLKLPRCANRRCMGHATMSTERGNDRLITANYSARTFLLSRQTKNPLAIWLSTVLDVHSPTTL